MKSPHLTLSPGHHKPPRYKFISKAARIDMNAALARAIAHRDVGHPATAQHFGATLVRLMREHGLLGDA